MTSSLSTTETLSFTLFGAVSFIIVIARHIATGLQPAGDQVVVAQCQDDASETKVKNEEQKKTVKGSVANYRNF